MTILESHQQMIRILEAIQHSGSFSKAADQLYLTQPTLSKRIRIVEKQYDVELVNRHQHPLTLSPAGSYYLAKLKTIVQDYQTMSNRLFQLSKTTHQTLRIGVNESLAQLVLPPVLTAYHQQFPTVAFELIEQTSEQMEAALLTEKLDFYIGVTPAYNPLINQINLYSDTGSLVLPKSAERTASHQPITDISALITNYDVITETPASGFQRIVTSYFTKYHIKPNVIVQTANLTTALHLAAGGLGATVVPATLLTRTISKSATIIPIKSSAMNFQISLSRNTQVPLTAEMKAFIQLAKQKLTANR